MAVRDLTLEYDVTPFSDQYIIDRLNEAYRYVYNAYVKAQDTLFAQEHSLQIAAGTSTYELPENLWNKRVEALWVPSPPYQSDQPWGWEKITKVDYLQSYRYQSNRVRVYTPEVWSQLNNKIYVFPLPLINYTAKLIISRRLPPLGIYGGRIVGLSGSTITIDALNDARISANAGLSNTGYISVCDFTTGEIKALYYVSSYDAVTKIITLGAIPAGRTSYMSYPISAAPAGNFGTIELDDIVTYGYCTGESIFGENFDNLLINWVVGRMRGTLNESDPETLRALTAQIQDLKGDTAGRPLGIQKTSNAFNQFKVNRPTGR